MPLADLGETLVGIVAIVTIFGWLTVVPLAAVGGIVWAVVAFINRRLKERRLIHEEVKLALERGADAEVVRELLRRHQEPPKSLVLKGAFILGWAVALAGFFAFLEAWSLAFLFGVGFGVMGISFIVYDIVRKRRKAE